MKKFGFMMMAAAVAAWSFTSCEKKTEEIIIDNTGTQEETEVKLPSVEGTEGAVTLVVKFDQAPCDGYDILFVGKYDDTSWEFASSHKFEALNDGWYKIVLKPGEVDAESGVCISGRPIQGKGVEADWSWDWSHSGDDLVNHKGASDSNIADSGYGEINLNFTEADAEDAIVVFLESKKWNVSPCASAEKYNITFKAPAFCDAEYDIEIVGSFEGWGANPVVMTKNGNVYTAEIEAKAGDEIKFRGKVTDGGDTWGVQVHGFSADEDKWNEMGNQKLADEKSVTFDWSDPTVYSWNICLE